MLFKHRGWVVACAAMVGCSAAAQAAVSYTNLYTVGEPAGFTFAGYLGDHQLYAGGQTVGDGVDANGEDHALLWSPATPNGLDINPGSGFNVSQAYATNGTQQVGGGSGSATGGAQHALLWSGTAASAVDLHPTSGFSMSLALGVDAGRQAGWGQTTGGAIHAMTWAGSADSAVDLNPANYDSSLAYGTDATQQVGYAFMTGDETQHAMLWSGSAGSSVDLHPGNMFGGSYAYGAGGNQQVGVGVGTIEQSDHHALLWTGSAASYVDLNGSFALSEAYATDGTRQVGFGQGAATGGAYHAVLWNGSADGYLDLHSVLPAMYTNSFAYSIVGNTVYGEAVDADGNHYAIVWNVPEPTGAALMSIASLVLLRRRQQIARRLSATDPS